MNPKAECRIADSSPRQTLNTKYVFLLTFVALLIGYFLSFVIFYLSNYIFVTDLMAYIWLFANKLTYLLFPLVTALTVFISAPFIGSGKALLYSIPQLLARFLYFIPYFYLKYIVEGYSSVECLGIGLILSLGEALISFGAVALIYLIMKLILEKSGLEKKSQIFKICRLDFGAPVAVAIAVCSALACAYFLIGEVADTVSVINDYGLNLTLPEIIYITASYIFDILIAPIYFFALAFIKNRMISVFGYESGESDGSGEEKKLKKLLKNYCIFKKYMI